MGEKERPLWRERLRVIRAAVINGWLELLAVSPVLVIVAGLLREDPAKGGAFLASLAAYPVLTAGVASIGWLRWRWLLLLVQGAAIGAWGGWLYGLSPASVLSWIVGIAAAYRATQLVRWGDQAALPGFAMWLGLGAMAPCAFLVHQSEGLQGYSPLLPYLGAALLAAAVWMSNDTSIGAAFYGGRQAQSPSARSMRQMNRLLIGGFAVVVLLVSFLGWGGPSLYFLRRLLPSPGAPRQPEEPEAEPPMTDAPFMLEPEGPPPWWWQLLERLVLGLGAVVGAALAAAALWWLGRQIPVWLRDLALWLARRRESRAADGEAGYVDVVTSTRAGLAAEPGPWARLLKRLRTADGVRYEHLRTNRERVRHLYALAVRRAVREGLHWEAQWTPAETARAAARAQGQAGRHLDPALSSAYDRARYGGPEPTDAETARWKARSERASDR